MALTEQVILPQAAKIKTKIRRWHQQVRSDRKQQPSPESLFVLLNLRLPSPRNAEQPTAQGGILSQALDSGSLCSHGLDTPFSPHLEA